MENIKLNKILYFTSYFRLFKYMVAFSKYFTVCVTYQQTLVDNRILARHAARIMWITNACRMLGKRNRR